MIFGSDLTQGLIGLMEAPAEALLEPNGSLSAYSLLCRLCRCVAQTMYYIDSATNMHCITQTLHCALYYIDSATTMHCIA